MSFSGFRAGRLLASVSLVALLAACAVTPEPFTKDELAAQAKEDRADMFKGGEPLTSALTVSDAIARAVRYNLDKRSKMMDEALALGQTDVDRWDLLPKLTANAGYNERSEPNSTRSRDLYTQTTSTSNPTYSADRFAKTADLTMSWNVLDFGLTYYTAKANADRALVATERRRKAVHNLISEVRFAFWRAAAYQTLNGEVNAAVAEAKVALDKARLVERENLKAPVESLRYQKSLLETLRQLTAIQQELSTARIELAALINVPPGTDLVLNVPADMKLPDWQMGLERMEETAFVNNPDLREQGYLTRIALDDTKKAIIRMLPGVTFTASRNYDYNSFLMDNHWYEAGAKLSWNLMNVISGHDALKYADANEETAKARRLALRMAVLAQVHVSERQFRNASSQFTQSDDLWKVDRRLFELSDAKAANDASGILERVAGHASAIASQLRRFQTYAQVEQAYAKMQATLGDDLLPDSVKAADVKNLSIIVARRLEQWGKGEMAIPMGAEETPVAPTPAMDAAAPAKGTPDLLSGMVRFFQDGLKQPEEVATPSVSAPQDAIKLSPSSQVEARDQLSGMFDKAFRFLKDGLGMDQGARSDDLASAR
ncbi:Outer membrane efflux protein [Magnetospirillum sp. XM-1]|uniref:TolC family protein n=1 Tax=Magnetospirillum sp. XM-1 TaxID=1663591 RepID=UPI00073DDCDC|nr:TolC family protein [Magnetospirillum sp. XM-1]CUW40824.1 Outer membrane efflux protein [Magnetospirillum sp. XM-1]